MQDAFILAYYSIDKLKDNNKFGPWVLTITRNVSLRYLEKKQQNKSTPFSALSNRDFDTEGYTRADSPLAEKELMQLIDNLPEGYRKVFKMAVIEGYSHKEIAEKLDIEPHSSSSQLTRAKAMLFIVNVKNSKCHAVYARLQVSITNYISKKTCIK